MIVTEREARAKGCHAARCAAKGSSMSFNRLIGDDGQETGARCVGTDCMHWRWAGPVVRQSHSSTKREGWEFIDAPDCYDHDSNEPFWLEPHGDAQKRRCGYCGLAGKPDHA